MKKHNIDKLSTIPSRYTNINEEYLILESTEIENGVSNMKGIVEGNLAFIGDKMDLENKYILYLDDDKFEIEDLLLLANNVNGLIIKRGNPLSHLSIIARELGIMIIYGVKNLRGQILPNTRIRLNGNDGSITVIIVDNAERDSGEGEKSKIFL